MNGSSESMEPLVNGGPTRRRRTRRALLGRWFALALAAVGAGGFAAAGRSEGAAMCGALAAVVAGALLTSALIGRRLVAVTVQGRSMEPAYHHGDRVLVRRGVPLRTGQVAVVDMDRTSTPLPSGAGVLAIAGRRWMIKRVTAVEGDLVPREAAPALADVPEERVPTGRVVLLGDNASASHDSRQAGYFEAARVLGVSLRKLS